MLRALADAALAVLLAPCCACCQAVLVRPLDGAVCATCWASIVRFSPPLCTSCGEPLPSVRVAPSGRCGHCSVALGAIASARAIGPFDGRLVDIVHALKYGPRRSVAAPLAALMRTASHDLLSEVDVVVPVPLHRTRWRERGFNQAELLAAGLGPPLCQALTRCRATSSQVGLSGHERRANLRGAFALTAAAVAVRGRVVALVDDVLTTGTTLAACAATLAGAAPARMVAVTAARAVRERPQ